VKGCILFLFFFFSFQFLFDVLRIHSSLCKQKKNTVWSSPKVSHFGVQINAAIRVHVLSLTRLENKEHKILSAIRVKNAKICKWDEIKKDTKELEYQVCKIETTSIAGGKI
jgi:hypothetical protein